VSKKIIIVGGGYAGIEAAKRLEKKLGRNNLAEITLIDRNPYHTLMTELHEVAGSRTEPEAVKISFLRIFAGSRVAVKTEEVLGVDFENRKVKTTKNEYDYDYLVLSTGGRPEFFGIEGVQQHSFTLWSLEDALRIRTQVDQMFHQAAKESDFRERQKLLSFVIAGAGFTGVELVGELIERANVLCRQYHIDRNEVTITLVEAMDRILPIISDKTRKAAQRYLEKKGVKILLNAPIVKAMEGAYILNDRTRVEGSILVWTCGVQASEFTAKINLTKGKMSNDQCSIVTPQGIHGMAACYFEEDEKEIVGQRGRILVNEHMQSVDYQNVYLCGDVIWYVHKERVVPQIVENALQTAHTVAENIIADIKNKPLKAYQPQFHGFMVSIGSQFAVATVMGKDLIGFFAMALKHLINLHYLWGVAGFNAVWGYLKEEFVDVRNHRSILHGHLSAKIPTFLVLPARLWLGFVWLMEGLNKIAEGWLNFDRSRTSFMFSKGVVQAGAEALTQASPVVSDTATQATQWAADTATAATTAQATELVSKFFDFEKPILSWDSWPVELFRTLFMDGLSSKIHFALFQTAVVATEVLIGLALLGGLMTVPAAAASIALCVVFTLSGMFSWSQLWFVVLAIVLLGGAGKSFGSDHYFVPWVKRLWSSTKLAQRTYLYGGEPTLKFNHGKSQKKSAQG